MSTKVLWRGAGAEGTHRAGTRGLIRHNALFFPCSAPQSSITIKESTV